MRDSVELIAFAPRWLDELIPMWRASFEAGVGITDPRPLAEQQQYFLTEVLPRNSVRLATQANQLVGFVAASRESVAQLYVRVGAQRHGVGAQLLTWAKAQSAGSLWLYTFARNAIARSFYDEDIKYRWRLRQGHYEGTQSPRSPS